MDTNQTTQNNKVIKLNPQFYPPEVVYSASYVLLEKAYFWFDGDPRREMQVSIIPKEGYKADEISKEFNEELINYLEYRNNYERNKDIRYIILQKAIETAQRTTPPTSEEEKENTNEDELEEIDEEDLFDSADEDLSYLDEDPLEIAVPWEEKYGGEEKKNNQEKESQEDTKGEEK